jgi:hypothetical protein
MNRKMTKKIMKELDEGLRDPRQLCHELLAWMSEDDVASFALVYGHGYDEDDDNEDDSDEETKKDLNELASAEEIESSFFDETWRDDLNWQAV